MVTSNQATAVRTTCLRCGERLGSDDNFCVGCGQQVAGMSGGGAATPGGTTVLGTSAPLSGTPAPLPTRAELRLTALPRAGSSIVVTCSRCQTTLGPEERFCSGCGRPRDGTEVLNVTGLESKAEAGWREVQDRLQAATEGRYQVVRELGRGGMAAVYLAKELALSREVAIKVMRPSFLLDPGMVERFLREARTMASLRHPNIVAIHSVEEANQLYFFVMQYIAGRSLDRVIGGEQLPVAAMQAVIFEAAAALTHAHKQGVVHRDIKPANIMLDRDGNAIVTDFGIAKVADVQATSATVGQMGTPLYMSPEQCEGLTVTPQADQYSLGNVAYEMLTGVPPFQRATAIALGTAILHDKPKPIRAFRDDCPPDIEAAVLRMLAKAPTERFPTLTEAAAALGGDRLADDDPLREYLRILAQRDSRSDGRHLTPRPSKTGRGWRRHWTGSAGRRLRQTVAAVILVGTLAPLAYYGVRRYRQPDGPIASSTVVVPGLSGPTAAPIESTSTPPPPTVVRTPPIGGQAARLRALLASVRSSLRRNDWRPASDSLAAAIRTGPRTTELANLEAQVKAGLLAAGTGTNTPPVQGPTPTPIPVVVGPPAAPTRVFDETPVLQTIDAYVAAINSRNLGQIRRVYIGMTDKQATDWRENRLAREIKQLTATATRPRIEATSDGAKAVFVLDLTLVPDGAAPLTYRIHCDAVLRAEGGEWKIHSLSERGEER